MVMNFNICENLGPFLRIVVYIMKFAQWVLPFILIALITFDFVKAITTNDEKVMEHAKSYAGKRIVFAIVAFVVPIAIRLIFSLLFAQGTYGDYNSPTNWIECFNQALNEV